MAEIKLRLDEPLRARIEAAARRNGRSMNAEMIACLERMEDGLDDAKMAVIEADGARYRQRLIKAARKEQGR